MTILRCIVLASASALAVVAAGVLPATAASPAPAPVVTLAGSISPHDNLRPGTPLSFTLDTRFASVPPGGNFVLQRLVYLFPHGTVVNGRLFPSCAAARLERAHGRLSACPKGSKVGAGFAIGTAVALGISSRATVTLFNGPGGRSITMNIHITTPALIDATIAAPFVTVRGRYANKLTVDVPESLQSVLDTDIVTRRIHVTTGATRVVHGVRRGYVEVVGCPKSRKARIHGTFSFKQGVTATADTAVAC